MLALDTILKVDRMLSQTGGREGFRDNYPVPVEQGKQEGVIQLRLGYEVDAKTGDLRLVSK